MIFLNVSRVVFGLITLLGMSAFAKSDYGVGQRDFTLTDSARNRSMVAHVWYPIDPRTKTEVVGKSGPFVPVRAGLNQAISKEKKNFPLVLLSHGSGGTAAKLFWLTESLVTNGSVVIGVDHPGNMTGDNSAEGIMNPWQRALDLSFCLEKLSQHEMLKPYLDLSRVSAIGHSAGGATVLLLAGARLSADRFTSPIPNCATSKDPYVLKFCAQIQAMDLKSVSKQAIEGDYRNKTITAVVALDPGFARSFDPKSFKLLTTKILVIGADKQPAPEDQIFSREFREMLPRDAFEILPESIHMTFLQPCKPGLSHDDPELKVLCVANDKKATMQYSTARRVLNFIEAAK